MRTLTAASYEELRRRHLADMTAMTAEAVERIDWPAERLAVHRRTMLRHLLVIACQRSLWHRERLGAVAVGGLDEDGLAALPVMTKSDLMENFDAIVTDRRLSLDLVESHLSTLTGDAYLLDRYHAVASSGTSGMRGVFVYGWEAWALFYLSLRRHSLRSLAAESARATAPIVVAKLGAQRALHPSRAIAQTFADAWEVIHSFPVTMPTEQLVDELNRLQPAVLEGYSSTLYQLVSEARSGRLRIAPRRVAAISEPLLPEIRSALAQAWGVPVMNTWATSEGGGCAASCGTAPAMHLSEDLLIIEPVDADGAPTRPGIPSAKVYLTNLYNPTLPLIRYEITDEVRVLDQRCTCGSVHRLIDDIHGRLDDSFRYGHLTVHPHVFRSALGGHRHVIEYQVHQTARGANLAVRCREGADLAGLRAQLVAEWRGWGWRIPRWR